MGEDAPVTYQSRRAVADFADLSLRHRLEMAAYRWRRVEPLTWTPLGVPLHEARIGLVTTAGLHRPGTDQPFERVRGGDTSFRIIPDDVHLPSLAIGQTSHAFDRQPVEADRNVALPIDRLRTLVEHGAVGSSAARHLSFNGSITAPGRLVRQVAPEAAEVFRQEQVDAVLLVPV
jgi:D-proline reductase (dithiol) PrdB